MYPIVHSVIFSENIVTFYKDLNGLKNSKNGLTLWSKGLKFNYSQHSTVAVQKYHGGVVSLQQFRHLAVENLQQQGNFIVVNYSRGSLGQKGGGHISPIGAYHEQSDRFLILDVARYRYSPVWVEAEALWEAMKTVDSASAKTRGFILINVLNAERSHSRN